MALRDQSRSVRHLAAVANIGLAIGDDDLNDPPGWLFPVISSSSKDCFARCWAGSSFRRTAAAPGRCRSPIVTESLWRNRFRADRHMIGQTVRINNRPVVLVGVVPNGTSSWVDSLPTEAWLPFTALVYFEPGRDVFRRDDLLAFHLAGRLSPGILARAGRGGDAGPGAAHGPAPSRPPDDGGDHRRFLGGAMGIIRFRRARSC